MKSCLYEGFIRHRRFTPRVNDFRYQLFLMYLDLSELPQLFDKYWFWSARRPALAWFRRADFLGDPSQSLDTAVRDRIETEFGVRPSGPIRLLTHIRYFGYNFNPVNFYYVFDEADTALEYVVAEITNTPWDERHAYVLRLADAEAVGAQVKRWQFDKAFHVSPFLPMDMRYDWRFTAPSSSLAVHMENSQNGQRVFDATLTLSQVPLTSYALARALLAFPLMTVKVSALIYWQALKLWLKRTPFFTHPDKQPQ
ncbi:MAG: DUF1365 domain-containing protein [Steroidobacteraceae bacterium]|jgi:DUF1365 family protein|nr:DUF1365 domain-containing protein [Gammaproteobacteria bacterium]